MEYIIGEYSRMEYKREWIKKSVKLYKMVE